MVTVYFNDHDNTLASSGNLLYLQHLYHFKYGGELYKCLEATVTKQFMFSISLQESLLTKSQIKTKQLISKKDISSLLINYTAPQSTVYHLCISFNSITIY